MHKYSFFLSMCIFIQDGCANFNKLPHEIISQIADLLLTVSSDTELPISIYSFCLVNKKCYAIARRSFKEHERLIALCAQWWDMPLFFAAARLNAHRFLTKRLDVKNIFFKHPYEDVSLLHYAAKYNAPDVAKLLLELGIEINCKGGSLQSTALHYAAEYNASKTAQILLARGADTSAQNQWGQTPLHRAALQDSYDVARLLLRYRSSKYVRDYAQMTPYNYALSHGYKPMLTLLC